MRSLSRYYQDFQRIEKMVQRESLRASIRPLVEVVRAVEMEGVRQKDFLQALSLEVETMRHQKFKRNLEVLQAYVESFGIEQIRLKKFLRAFSQMPFNIALTSPQKATKAISEAEPPKKKKAEPLSMEECRQILKDNLL